jgi:uncharacterized GH25 family protein
MKKISSVILTSLSLLVVSPALAHSIWLEEEGEDLTIKYGHVEEEFEGYDPEKVETVTAYDQQRNSIITNLIAQDEKIVLAMEKMPSLVAVTFDNGYWVETEEGWQNISKQAVDSYINSSRTYKYTKALYNWSSAFTQSVGLTLEITYNGSEGEIIETNDNGIATIPVKESGLHYLEANYRYTVENNPKTDEIGHSSTFTFERN